MSLRMLLATPLYPPDSGGPAMEAALLVEELPKYGFDIDVCSFGLVRHLPRGIRHIRYAAMLIRRAIKADCIVTIDTFSACVPAAIASILTRKPLIVRVPGDFVWEQSVQRFGVTDTIEEFQKKRYNLRVEIMRAIEHWAVRRGVLVVTCSDFLKNIVAGWGVDAHGLMRIYLGTDLSEKAELPADRPAGRIIYSLGRFVPWKGFGMLIDLMSELPTEWKLVIAGEGPLRSQYQALVKERNLEDRVFLPGLLSRAQVLGWYRSVDVFVLNSHQENFSFQVLEAMAAGANIVTTTTGAIPELISDGVEGVLCVPDDKTAFKRAILSTVENPEPWAARRRAASLKAQTLSAEASARAFAEAVRGIMHERV